jgi:hypothetical protein
MTELCTIYFLSRPNAPDNISVSLKICPEVCLYALHTSSYTTALCYVKRHTYLKKYFLSGRFTAVCMIHSQCIN